MLFDNPSSAQSPFNIGLSRKGGNNHAVDDYFKKRVTTFCKDIAIGDFNVRQIPFEDIFTDVEFNKHIPDENEESFINKHFYEKVFSDLKRKFITIETTGKEFPALDFKPKFCFTLDKGLTPEISSSGIPYGILKLGNKAVLYYVWVDIQVIIDLVKIQ